MSNSNLLQGYTWDTHDEYDDDPQQQFPRPIQDEVISVYEVYVKEETVGADGRSDISIVSDDPSCSSNQFMQADCLDLDAAIGSEVINVDGTITKLLQGKEASKYKIPEQNNANDENVVVYSHPAVSDQGPSAAAATRLVDKDDPRSRLHFVKYLKRDGKTLKIWECGICTKEFRHQYTLMRHLPTHTDERNFKCEACGKAFRQLSTLSQHRAIHSDARPYVCEFCKKTFNRVSTLISHRKTHSEHKPHKCHMCGKGFHQKGNLRNHVFTHTNERPYKCETCGKGFNQMSNLMCHKIKTHAYSEKMQYACGICAKEFPRRSSLRSHEEYKHGIKYRNPNAPAVIQDINDPILPKNKNVSIVQPADRPMTDQLGDKENLNPAGLTQTGSVIVDKIETKAMENAIFEGQTPFALYKPLKGIPVLVKVGSPVNRKQILTPATAEDLRMAGKMSLSPTLAADVDGVKAVQIKVPVVATVTQRIEPDGTYSYLIEPPGPGQEQESLIEPIESQFSSLDHQRGTDLRNNLEKNSQVHVNQASADQDCSDLLELAAQGGIQFVRATEDGRYEVMTNSEARDLMAQNSHDVTILDGEEAEAISVVNLRGEHHEDNEVKNSQNQEIVIGDLNNQITVLNSGNNSGIVNRNNLEIDGIEILGDKDIRILQGTKNFDNDLERFAQNGICTVYNDHEKIHEYQAISGTEYGFEPISGSINENLHLSNHQNYCNFLNHNSLTKNPQNSTFSSKNPLALSSLNHNFPSFKHSSSFGDGPSTVFSGPSDHAIVKNESTDLNSSKFKYEDFDTNMECSNRVEVSQPEVRILGSKNQNRVKILGHSIDKAQIEKVLKFENSRVCNNNDSNVKILGSKNSQMQLYQAASGDFNNCKDVKILGSSYNHDQLNSISQIKKDQVKVLGKKKDAQVYSSNQNNNPATCTNAAAAAAGLRNSLTTNNFEVATSSFEIGRCSRVPEMILIEDSPKIDQRYKSGDFIQTFYKTGNEIEIDMIENFRCMRGLEMHVDSLNCDYRISSSDDEDDNKIKEVTTISEREFEMISHCAESTRYDSLPDLD